MLEPSDDSLTVCDVAKLLHIHPITVRLLIWTNRLDASKIDGQWYVLPGAVEKFLRGEIGGPAPEWPYGVL